MVQLLLFYLFLAFPVWAGDGVIHPTDSSACARAWAPYLEGFEKYQHLNTDAFTMKQLGPGQHGGKRIVFERSAEWFDSRKSFKRDGADFTQDLRVFPQLLGTKNAHFFGFEQLSDKQMALPDVGELNGAISKFNEGLSADDPLRMPLRFYETPEAFVSSDEYVRRFVDKNELPISRSGRQFMHDISVHSLEGFFLDNRLIETLRGRAKLWLDFMQSVQTPKMSSARKDLLKATHKKVMTSLLRQIDFLGTVTGPEFKVELFPVVAHDPPEFFSKFVTDPELAVRLREFLVAGEKWTPVDATALMQKPLEARRARLESLNR